MINVTLLLNTIEDAILTHADISKVFDKNIADSVERLTRIKPYGKISSSEMLNLLIQEPRYDIALIKVLDRLHKFTNYMLIYEKGFRNSKRNYRKLLTHSSLFRNTNRRTTTIKCLH